IRKLSYAIINSTTVLLPLWKAKCIEHKLPERLIPRDVATRWNSTYDLLVFAVKYTTVIDAMTGDKSNRSTHDFDLELEEWRIINDLVRVLKDATLFFSRDDISTIASVIPTMDKIDLQLTHGSTSNILPTLHSSVRMALLLAKKKMNHYYARTDESNVYRIAMSISTATYSICIHSFLFSSSSGPEACLL
ncbi:hypothetical protein DFH06DRAFT_1008907, partial [Mycena polygramma]